MVIAIDFDDTITERSPFPITGIVRKDFIKYGSLLAKKHTLVLNTARRGKYRREAVKMLKDLPIKTNIKRKPNADLYIDNKNIFCEEINWKKIYEYINSKY